MNYCLNMMCQKFMNLSPFWMLNSDLERELYEKSAPVNNEKIILTVFMKDFTWSVIFRYSADPNNLCLWKFE